MDHHITHNLFFYYLKNIFKIKNNEKSEKTKKLARCPKPQRVSDHVPTLKFHELEFFCMHAGTNFGTRSPRCSCSQVFVGLWPSISGSVGAELGSSHLARENRSKQCLNWLGLDGEDPIRNTISRSG